MFSSNTTDVSATSAAAYIEDVFSTYIYTGNGSTQTIVNNIDLSTKGGLVWNKRRDFTASHFLFDTASGVNYALSSDSTSAETAWSPSLTSFNTNGFSLNASTGVVNVNAGTFATWTFRKQPKFFDVVTYTGTGSARTVAHSLGSVPGCIIIKQTSAAGQNWRVWHTSLDTATDQALALNLVSSQGGGSGSYWNYTLPTSSVFTVGTDGSVNASGQTYVAYVFATNAGGFGLTGTDNVITCGSFTSSASSTCNVTLGFEPQWLLIKSSTASQAWRLFDVMRGFSNSNPGANVLEPSNANAEASGYTIYPTSTGFAADVAVNSPLTANATYVYIAIRRGPMKVPTDATTVFAPITSSAGTGTSQTTNFPVDLQVDQYRLGEAPKWVDRLRGVNSPNLTNATPWLVSNATSAEATSSAYTNGWSNTGFLIPSYYNAASTVYWNFRRAPGFFDEVCWTGTSSNGGATATFNHNLGVVPEMIILKLRAVNGASGYTPDWFVYTTALNSQYGYPYNAMYLNSSAAFTGVGMISSAPTTTTFSLEGQANVSPATYVAYLFATCAGVSKVGSYTGTGALQTVNCGFTGGARFVLIKRTDSTGDWYVYDSARGITSGNDPYLLLNSTAAETTGTNYVDTDSTGFKVTAAAPAGLNASGGTYIFLAIS